jgi:hypothetical protein
MTTSSVLPPRTPVAPERPTSAAAAAWIGWSPVVIAVAFALLLVMPATHKLCLWLISENNPVEDITFLSLLVGAIGAFWMSAHRRFTGGDRLLSAFFVVLGVGLFLVAGEEIAWGQSLLYYYPPAYFLEHNTQAEVTLHNLPALEGHNGLMRLAFGVGGLVGLLAARWPRFAPIATPRVVMPWFLTITVIEVIDNVLGKHPVYRSINGFVIQYMNIQYSEVTEMLIGLAGFLYVWLVFVRSRHRERARDRS